MVSKRSEYRRQFKVSSLENNIPLYYEHVNYRNQRRERECAHTPISWAGDLLDSPDSEDADFPADQVERLPVSEIQIAEEKEDNIDMEKRKAQGEDKTKEDTADDVKITRENEALRKSAKEKLRKYVSAENKDDKKEEKVAVILHKQSASEFAKPRKVDDKTFSKKCRPRRPDRLNKVPKARPLSAPPKKAASPEPVKQSPFAAYGCESKTDTLGAQTTFNVRASSAVYPAALRAQRRNQVQIEKLIQKQKTASAREKRKKALFNDKMARETSSWDTEYRRNYPAYENTVYASSDQTPRKQKSCFAL